MFTLIRQRLLLRLGLSMCEAAGVKASRPLVRLLWVFGSW
jgi:hypothetical protein